MARYQITFQTIFVKTGKVASTAGTSVEAASVSEAKNKFNATHTPGLTYKYKILACVKK